MSDPRTDNLRTRIAKAIAGAVYGHNTLETAWADLHEDAQDEYFAEADAVIAELGLYQELRRDLDGMHVTHTHYRYVTEWTTDD